MWIYPFLFSYLTFFLILKWAPSIPKRQDWISANHFVLAIGSLIYLFSQLLESIILPWYIGYSSEYFSLIKNNINWTSQIYPILFLLSLLISLSYFKQKSRINLRLNNGLGIFLFFHVIYYLIKGQIITAIPSRWVTYSHTPIIPTNFLIIIPITLFVNSLVVFFKILPEFRKK